MRNNNEVMSVVGEYSKEFPHNAEISIGLIERGNITYYGFKKGEELRVTDNKDSVFGIGSITKVLTANILSDGVVKGEIELDKKLESYYDFNFKHNIDDTLLNLANHSSGFKGRGDDFEANINSLRDYYASFEEDELLSYLENLTLYDSSVLGRYSYSNYGYGLLGITLSKIYGKSVDNLIKEHVFDKYNMSNSYTTATEASAVLVQGLDAEGHAAAPWDLKALKSAGGVFSTVVDMTKYVQAHLCNSDLSLSFMRTPTLKVDQQMDIGLGIHVIKENDNTIYWHNGGGGGYKSAMEFDVDNQCGVIVLSNVSFFHPSHWDIDRICTKLMSELLDSGRR